MQPPYKPKVGAHANTRPARWSPILVLIWRSKPPSVQELLRSPLCCGAQALPDCASPNVQHGYTYAQHLRLVIDHTRQSTKSVQQYTSGYTYAEQLGLVIGVPGQHMRLNGMHKPRTMIWSKYHVYSSYLRTRIRTSLAQCPSPQNRAKAVCYLNQHPITTYAAQRAVFASCDCTRTLQPPHHPKESPHICSRILRETLAAHTNSIAFGKAPRRGERDDHF